MQQSIKYNTTTKPPKLEVKKENIPAELKQQNRWLVWDWELDNHRDTTMPPKKWTKPPKDIDKTLGSSTDSEKHYSFDEVMKSVKHFDGIGFAFSNNREGVSCYVGIDIDNSFESGNLSALGSKAIETLKTYNEVSPSGEGIKLLMRCTQDDLDKLAKYRKKSKDGAVEVYYHGRYFTVTGHLVDSQYKTITMVGESFWRFVDEYLDKHVAEYHHRIADLQLSDTLELAKSALECLDAGMDYGDWIHIGMGLHYSTQGDKEAFAIWDRWSSGCPAKYDGTSANLRRWEGFKEVTRPVTVGTLFGLAKENGWRFPVSLGLRMPSGRTENANATRFVNNYSDVIRFDVDANNWRVWNGNYWEGGDIAALGLMRDYANELWQELKPELAKADDKKPLVSFVSTSNSARSIRNALTLASTDRRVHASSDEFDIHDNLLNCQNGVLDCDTGKLYAHESKFMCTNIAGVAFDRTAKCPEWEKGIKLYACGDEKLEAYLAQLAGYCLVGGNPEAICPILLGDGSNGKSTFWMTISGVLGSYAGTVKAESLTGDRNVHHTWILDLKGKRLVVSEELEQGTSVKEAALKSVVGGDLQKGRGMGQDFQKPFRNTCTLWMPTNHLPHIKGGDGGIWNRLKLVRFDASLPRAGGKKNYHEWLIKHEGAGILNWMLKGYFQYKSNGQFSEPEAVKADTQQYRKDENKTLAAFEEWFAGHCSLDPQGEESLADLFFSFNTNGPGAINGKVLTDVEFSKLMRDKAQKGNLKRGPKKGNVCFRGVSLVDERLFVS